MKDVERENRIPSDFLSRFLIKLKKKGSRNFE